MNFLVKTEKPTQISADLLAVFVGWQKELDCSLDGQLSEVAKAEKFEDKLGETLLIHTHGKIAPRRVLLVGLGTHQNLSMFDWQTTCATIGRKAKEVAAKRIAIVMPDRKNFSFSGQIAKGAVVGLELGTYTFNKFKSKQAQAKETKIEEIILVGPAKSVTLLEQGIRQGQIVSEAVNFCRNLVNEPPGVTTPSYLGSVAKEIAKQNPQIKVEVLGRREIHKLGMQALLAIAQGSAQEPKFIKLEYRPSRASKTIAIAGKGITFDTGGLSLKSSEHMETMKLDMAGAATVLAIFRVLPKLAPKVNLVGLIAATENMPGGSAIKPGDIVRAMNGKTIEILNTDAEGRVILADTLSYASAKIKPDVLVDLATLTGACMIALGEEISGLFSNNSKLIQALKDAALQSGEKVWELPLAREYQEMIKSRVADIKNSTSKRYGGAITAALFLQEFVLAKIAWAHLDIAGPAYAEKDTALNPYGATGAGVRLLLEYLGLPRQEED